MSVRIITHRDEPELFWEQWELFWESAQLGPRFARLALEHILFVSRWRKLLVADRSFVYVVNSKPVACAFLPIEEHEGVRLIGFGGASVIAPFFTDDSIGKIVFGMIDDIAREEQAKKILFSIDSLHASAHAYNFLQKYQYLDSSILTYVIDLALPGDLLTHLRKGHHSDVKTVLNNPDYELFVVDRERPDYKLHEEYRELHARAAGRVTRPKESFDFQFKSLEKGQAFLVGLRYQKQPAAYAYFEYAHGFALYFSGADDPKYDHLPLYHALLIHAMGHARGLGISRIDVCQPSSPSTQFDYYPDEKQLSIARFKRGFGGSFASQFRGIKYFDAAMFARDAKLFTEEYLKRVV